MLGSIPSIGCVEQRRKKGQSKGKCYSTWYAREKSRKRREAETNLDLRLYSREDFLLVLLGDSEDFNDPLEGVLDGGGEFGGEGKHGELRVWVSVRSREVGEQRLKVEERRMWLEEREVEIQAWERRGVDRVVPELQLESQRLGESCIPLPIEKEADGR